ncbi:MAG: hypothetical protein ABW185_07335 [Sedimenticola sp.]
MEVERACFVEQADTKTAFLRQHINLVKIIGVIFILLSAFIIPSVVLMTTVCFPNNTYSSEIDVEANQTACMYVKQFALSRNMRVTVCNQGSEIIVDMRRFINGTSTIIGLPLQLRQWSKLKQLTPLIDRAIFEARTFWKDIDSY